MLRVIFHPTSLTKEDRARHASLELLESVQSGAIERRELLKTNALRMAEEFERTLEGTPFKVVQTLSPVFEEGYKGRVEMDIIAVKPLSRNPQALYDEMNYRIDDFEISRALPRRAECMLASVRI